MPVAYSSEEGPLSKSRNYKLAVEICVGESLKVHKRGCKKLTANQKEKELEFAK